MALSRRLAAVVLAAAGLAAALAYLRDPPWLEGMTSGLVGWIQTEDGRRARWAAGRSSFFVPADARRVRIPVRTTFDDPADWPVVITVQLDGRPVDRLTLRDPDWQIIDIPMPRPGSRRRRRVDLHLDRTRFEGGGILVGEVDALR